MLKPVFHTISAIETTAEKLCDVLASSEFTTRYWWVVFDGISKGWPAILSSLKSLLEQGGLL